MSASIQLENLERFASLLSVSFWQSQNDFHLCRLPKTTSIALTNHSLGWQSNSQSEVETNSLGYQARETACERLTVGFYVTPDFWLVKQARNSSNANSFTVQIRAVLGQSLEALNLLALRFVDYKRINSHNIKQREYLSVRMFLIEDRVWHSFELLM